MRVLIVDDDIVIAKSVAKALEAAKHKVEIALVKSADGALELIEKTSFDWLVLDINLTGDEIDFSGITVAQEVLQSFRRNIILHSSMPDDSRVYWAKKLAIHEVAKRDVPSMLKCMAGECGHLGRP